MEITWQKREGNFFLVLESSNSRILYSNNVIWAMQNIKAHLQYINNKLLATKVRMDNTVMQAMRSIYTNKATKKERLSLLIMSSLILEVV